MIFRLKIAEETEEFDVDKNVRKDLTGTTLLFSPVEVIICFEFGLVFFPLRLRSKPIISALTIFSFNKR